MAQRLSHLLEQMLGVRLPLRLRGWDGSEVGPPGAPVVVFRNRLALRRLLWQPNELGLGRAYVAGDIELDGDMYEALRRLDDLLWQQPERAAQRGGILRGGMSGGETVRDLIRLGAVGPAPRPPAEEASLRGNRHSLGRDRRAISHHYDVGNDFYRLVLGESMVYSCAFWRSGDPDGGASDYGLADAQRDKLELICRKLALRPGMRLLDVGCGWGSLAIHAAREHGVSVVGVTLSHEQVEYARKRVAQAGLADRVEIRLQDYRDISDDPFNAISSVGMAEHVGLAQYAQYAALLFRRLRPGGRLLNHQIAALHPTDEPATLPGPLARLRRQPRSFIDAYVFPDGELAPGGATVSLLERAGFEVRDVEALREHYARTLRVWVSNLEANWDEAIRLTTPGRARVWRLYMAGSALSFEAGRIGVNQILAVKADADGRSGMPPTRDWLR
ncbi:cyclopropane-fatty-acyl-phospholipid synthase family protein [Planosporangium flavigriseum]|uniref:Cyclopropane-fatty-acyl-phospholipid synthase n=1 Tax=Planosporangium flavigriseum TaxID=373681 RepID=A0A8J3M3Z6_9ACTN|nr:cyclopropane-fatty-acyl-phospholipid synthase [Planosporangium flavigriseum]